MKTRNQVVAALMHWPSDTFIDHVHKLIVDNERLMQTNEWYENRLISVSEEKDRHIRELEEAQKWISVEDRLPEERMLPVLVFNGTAPLYNQHVFEATWFLQRMNFKSEIEGYKYIGEITHWMPLPNPPKP